jgi:hypothetical protein
MKPIKFIVECVYWLNLFVVPVAILGTIGFVVNQYHRTSGSLVLFISLLIAGNSGGSILG